MIVFSNYSIDFVTSESNKSVFLFSIFYYKVLKKKPP